MLFPVNLKRAPVAGKTTQAQRGLAHAQIGLTGCVGPVYLLAPPHYEAHNEGGPHLGKHLRIP